MSNTNIKFETADLRKKALEILKNKPVITSAQQSDDDMLKLIHELEVHQIELELQNEELMHAKSDTQEAVKKYTELYDFAPSGYFTLSKTGEINELNLRGANMLGKERSHLKKSLFGFFVSNDTKAAFNQFLANIFKNKEEDTCVVSLNTDVNIPIDIYLDGIYSTNGEECLITAVDITERMLLVALKKKADKLELWNKLMEGREQKIVELKLEINELLKKSGEEEKYVVS